MGDFIIITLMVSSFWLLWEIIRVVSMEWLNRDVSGHGYQKGGTFRAGYG